MRSTRLAYLFCFLLVSFPVWAQQSATAPETFTTQPASDSQAVAVVQAAITALGGATAVAQAQSWTFQGEMQGPVVNDNVKYTITTQTPPLQQITTRQGKLKNKMPMTQSYFVPVLIGTVLAKQLQDGRFSMSSIGSVTVNSNPCAAVTFSISPSPEKSPPVPAQIWCFDSTTNLPVQVEFRLPAQVGASISPVGYIYFSDYRAVSGVMYPFFIGIPGQGGLPEIIKIQSVVPHGNAVSPEFNSGAGDIGR